MAIVLPNFGEQLGKDIAGLGEGLAHIIDPMIDFHTKFRSAIAENPEILQKLTDYAYLNKGDLGPAGKYIPKDVRESVVKAQPSIDAREHKGLMDAFDSIDPETRKIFLQARSMHTDPLKMTTDPIVIKNIKGAMEKYPQLGEFAGVKALTGEGPGAVSKDQMVAELGPRAREYYYTKMTDEERQAAAADEYGLLKDKHFQASLDARYDLFKLRSLNRVDHIHETEANTWYNKSGGVGSPDLWEKYLYDPKIKDRITKLKSGQGGVLTEDDQDYLQIDRARKEAGGQFERAHSKASVDFVRNLFDHISGNEGKKIDPDNENDRAIDLHALNGELNYLGLPYQAMFGQAPPTSEKKGGGSIFHPFDKYSKRLRFINSKTKEEADPEKILQGLESNYRLTESQHAPDTGPIKQSSDKGEGHAISLSDLKPDERRFATGTLSNARAALARAGADTSAIKDRITKSSTPQVSAYILKELGLQ